MTGWARDGELFNIDGERSKSWRWLIFPALLSLARFPVLPP